MKMTLLRLLTCVVFSAATTFAQQSAVFAPGGKAINGYDPVAYFTEGKPVPGHPGRSFTYQGATWSFASQQHLDAFKADPDKYAPQYGGYCAFGLSAGYKAPTKPDAWTIVGDKLYLNYNQKVRADWNKAQAEHIKKADRKWQQVKNNQ